MKFTSRALFPPRLLSLLIFAALQTQGAQPSTDDTLVVSAAPTADSGHEDATQKSAMLGNAGRQAVRNTPFLSLIHISEPTRHFKRSRMPSSA